VWLFSQLYIASVSKTERPQRRQQMAGRLAGKVAIVTGAAPQGPGIGNGSDTAILFAREGAAVVLVNRSLSHAQTLQRTIEQEGGTCAVYAADVSKAADVQQLVETVIQQYGKLDILLNNVGIFVPGTIETVTEEAWDTAMQVNVKGTMLCCKYSIPSMKAQGGGAIVAYRREESLRLAQDMPAKDITLTQDETFTGGLCLVGMEPVSNYIFLEQAAQARDQDTWNALMEQALSGLNCRVIQSISDEAPGLLAYVAHHLGAHHSPDLFHVQQELVKAVSGALAAKQRAAASFLRHEGRQSLGLKML
jgi:short chain dehydrogenase